MGGGQGGEWFYQAFIMAELDAACACGGPADEWATQKGTLSLIRLGVAQNGVAPPGAECASHLCTGAARFPPLPLTLLLIGTD